MRLHIVGFLFFCTTAFHGLAQEVQITGKVTDSLGTGIPNVSITYKTPNSLAILGYTMSSTEGTFRLSVSSQHDSITLTVSHLGYDRETRTVANRAASYTFTLKTKTERLPEVSTGRIPIFRRKDTISYAVDAFTAKQDRVIGDIIRKLPGIEMEGDRILYQGKPIRKYMVNNLDLMEGRYGMINKNLPADAVKNVQVVENDQPIKILDSLVFSDQASLNLELKKFTTTGTGKLGAGYAPGLWEANLTPMTFGKTFQALYSLQSNNIGDDVSKQLRRYYTGGAFPYGASRSEEQRGPSYTGVRGVSTPGFDERKWLDNRIGLLSTNMLQKLDDGLELKGNASYYRNLHRRSGYSHSQLFAPEGEVTVVEDIANRYGTDHLAGGVLLEKNEKEVYLRNDARLHRRWNRDHGQLVLNTDQPIDQHRRYDDLGLSNNLSMARFVGKQLVSFSSQVGYNSTPQQLRVLPGGFADLLNGDEPYAETVQDIRHTGFETSNNVSFARNIKGIRISPGVDLAYEWSRLESQIAVAEGDAGKVDAGRGFANDLHTGRLGISARVNTTYEIKKWRFSLNLPYNMAWFHARQFDERRLDGEYRGAFNPSTSVRLKWNVNNELTVNGTRSTGFGGLGSLYDGYIISNYRNISRYRSRILETDSWSAGANYRYSHTLSATFAHVSYSYSRGRRDYAYQTTLDDDGRAAVSVADVNTGNWSHRIAASGSKFFQPLKTVVKINGNVGVGSSDYLLNGIMGQRRQVSYGTGLEVINSSLDKLSVTYKMGWSRWDNELIGGIRNGVANQRHGLDVAFFPWEWHSLLANGAYYLTDLPGLDNQLFIDGTYRWTVNKWKIDIEASCINLLNNNRYIRRSNSDYAVTESYFDLRPRQFLVSTRFKF